MDIKRWGLLTILVLFVPALTSAADLPCADPTTTCASKLHKMLEQRGWAGLEMEASARPGLTVVRVLDGSPARRAGLLYGDTIVAINGTRINPGNAASLARLLKKTKPGSKATYTIARNGTETDIEVDLGAIPHDVRTRWITKYTHGGSGKLEFS